MEYIPSNLQVNWSIFITNPKSTKKIMSHEIDKKECWISLDQLKQFNWLFWFMKHILSNSAHKFTEGSKEFWMWNYITAICTSVCWNWKLSYYLYYIFNKILIQFYLNEFWGYWQSIWYMNQKYYDLFIYKKKFYKISPGISCDVICAILEVCPIMTGDQGILVFDLPICSLSDFG